MGIHLPTTFLTAHSPGVFPLVVRCKDPAGPGWFLVHVFATFSRLKSCCRSGHQSCAIAASAAGVSGSRGSPDIPGYFRYFVPRQASPPSGQLLWCDRWLQSPDESRNLVWVKTPCICLLGERRAT